MRIASLHIYPIKGVRAADLDRASVEVPGLAGDRRWLVVDSERAGITQRSHPGLATITARVTPSGLHLSAPGAAGLDIATPSGAARAENDIWGDAVCAALEDAEADRVLSMLLDDE
ncbi:MAG: MOSC domain-containing protein, partial [Amphiplicatus sp.]